MTEVSLHDSLNELDRAHRGDGDGGYALARDIAARLRRLGERELESIVDALIDEVDDCDEHWGVVLQSLVELKSETASRRLADLYVTQQGHDLAWKDEVLLTLLRVGQALPPSATADVSDAIAEDRPMAPALLAQLIGSDPAAYAALAPRLFLRLTSQGLAGRGYLGAVLPAHVKQLLHRDEGGGEVEALIASVARADSRAGSALAAAICDYLGKPWVSAELGPALVTAARIRLRPWRSSRDEL